MKKLVLTVISFGVCFMAETSCVTTGSNVADEDSSMYHVCMEFCTDRYSDAYGVEAREIRDGLVRCRCRRHRGDRIEYINVEEYESNEDVNVEVLAE